MSALYLEILDKERLEVFRKLSGFSDLGILGGGTAISLQIGHRRSFDFDIFTQKSLPIALWKKIRQIFGSGCVRTLDIQDQLNFLTPNNISVTFILDDSATLFPPLKTDYIDIMNLKDLASNKARVIGKRGKWRGYIDLYFLLKEGYTNLPEIIEVSQKRCQNEFPTRLFLQQLCYFKDIQDFAVDFIGDSVPPNKVRKFLTDQAASYSDKI